MQEVYLSGLDSNELKNKLKATVKLSEVERDIPDSIGPLYKEYWVAYGALLRSDPSDLNFAFTEGRDHRSHLRLMIIAGAVFLALVALLLFLIIPNP